MKIKSVNVLPNCERAMDKKLSDMLDKCTPKQRKFVEEYMTNGGNGLRAAHESYNLKTDVTAKSVASENLTKPNVAKPISRWQEIISTDANISFKKIVNGLAYVAEKNVDTEPKTMIAAVTEINKMMGNHNADKNVADAVDAFRDLAGQIRKKRLDNE